MLYVCRQSSTFLLNNLIKATTIFLMRTNYISIFLCIHTKNEKEKEQKRKDWKYLSMLVQGNFFTWQYLIRVYSANLHTHAVYLHVMLILSADFRTNCKRKTRCESNLCNHGFNLFRHANSDENRFDKLTRSNYVANRRIIIFLHIFNIVYIYNLSFWRNNRSIHFCLNYRNLLVVKFTKFTRVSLTTQ